MADNMMDRCALVVKSLLVFITVDLLIYLLFFVPAGGGVGGYFILIGGPLAIVIDVIREGATMQKILFWILYTLIHLTGLFAHAIWPDKHINKPNIYSRAFTMGTTVIWGFIGLAAAIVVVLGGA